MNFLAHLYLSGDNSELKIGNFIGDFVKGSQINTLPKNIQEGVYVHREIDRFTDSHEVVRQSKLKLRPKYRHYAPVIVDIYYDHFLAKNWDMYSSQGLLEYTQRFYEEIANYREIVPMEVNRMLIPMKQNNWLFNYRSLEGINRTFNGMAKRTTFDSKMEHATDTLKVAYHEFENEFLHFFPDLRQHITRLIQ
jgi:acyl carrier protein phosphodiesterase